MNIKPLYPLAGIFAAITLSGCGGSSSDSTDRRLVEVNAAKVSLKPLKSTAVSNFTRHLKNGIYTASISHYSDCANCSVADSAEQPSPVAGSSGNYSGTNTQEIGVDEADRIKYNGEYLYIAAKRYYDPEGNFDPDYIKVMQRQADTSMSEVATIESADGLERINGLYLHQDKLAAVGSSSVHFGIGDVITDIWHPVDYKVEMALYDVASPAAAQMQQFMSYDGYLISSRRVDNKLYLVSSYSPKVEGLYYGASTESDKQANYDKIQSTDISQLMPKLTVNNGTTRNLVEPQDCFIPEDATSADGYNSIVTLTTVDLSAPNNVQSVCINALTHDIYASTNAVYLMGISSEEKSVIHKFSMTEPMNYVGAGVVDGMLGWSAPSFRLSEHEGRLRVVSTSWQSGEPEHSLSILDAQAHDKKLNVLSQIPNEQRPEKIGKPNEDIYAVRFFNDKAYIVTYERIDPLYVVDLSNDADPFIAGALEIPGFSSYLHPINENLLLGVGQQIDPGRLPQEGGENATNDNPIDEGAKVSLFDVSDPANPTEVAGVVYTEGYTPVEWNHHALTYLPMSDNEYRFALPVTYWQVNPFTGKWQSSDTLQTLQVNLTDNGSELIQFSPVLPSADVDQYIGSYDDRSILHDEQIYYIHGNEVVQAAWGN